VGENLYTGSLFINIGPVQGIFKGQIRLSKFNAPVSYWIDVEGKGAAGVVKASGSLRLEPRGSQTYMEYGGQAQVGGRIASVGQRLIESSARSIIRQSLDALNEYLKTKMDQQSGQVADLPPAEVPPDSLMSAAANIEVQPASQSEFQPPLLVTPEPKTARDKFNNIVPVQYQFWLIGAAIVVIGFIAWLVASR
jgi:carbon monoxide dehydrogenase subunit G